MFKRVIGMIADFEGVCFLLSLVLGLGCLTYVAATWLMHFIQSHQLILAAAIVFASTVLAAAALVRIPLALVVVFGGSAVMAAAIASDSLGVLLP